MTMLVPLDPWIVYAEPVVGDDREVFEVDVPEIGVLPPAGNYVGTVTSTSEDRCVVRITVPARSDRGDVASFRRLLLEIAGPLGVSIPSPTRLVFQAIQHKETGPFMPQTFEERGWHV